MIHPEQTTFRDLLPGAHGFDTYKIDKYGDGIESVDNGESIPCRYLDSVGNDADADAVGHRSLGGSDYSGGSLVRSNLKAFRALVEEETGDGEPLPIVDYYGGHGTDGVLLLLDRKAPRDSLAPFVELLQGLEDYPVVCEDTLSALEMDDENEAWEGGAEADFAQALADKIDHPYAEIEDSTTTTTTLRELFSSIAESANLNGGPGVIHEETGPFFLVDDAAKAVSPVLLFALGFVKLDADTALEQAASTDTEDHDAARRVLRLSRLGRGLASIQRQLASAFYSASIVRHADGRAVGPLSKEANAAHSSEADRKAADIILRADIDAGDTDTGIGPDLPRAQRLATVTLDRFVWNGCGKDSRIPTVALNIDPDSPYTVDLDAIRAFVAD